MSAKYLHAWWLLVVVFALEVCLEKGGILSLTDREEDSVTEPLILLTILHTSLVIK